MKPHLPICLKCGSESLASCDRQLVNNSSSIGSVTTAACSFLPSLRVPHLHTAASSGDEHVSILHSQHSEQQSCCSQQHPPRYIEQSDLVLGSQEPHDTTTASIFVSPRECAYNSTNPDKVKLIDPYFPAYFCGSQVHEFGGVDLRSSYKNPPKPCPVHGEIYSAPVRPTRDILSPHGYFDATGSQFGGDVAHCCGCRGHYSNVPPQCGQGYSFYHSGHYHPVSSAPASSSVYEDCHHFQNCCNLPPQPVAHMLTDDRSVYNQLLDKKVLGGGDGLTEFQQYLHLYQPDPLQCEANVEQVEQQNPPNFMMANTDHTAEHYSTSNEHIQDPTDVGHIEEPGVFEDISNIPHANSEKTIISLLKSGASRQYKI